MKYNKISETINDYFNENVLKLAAVFPEVVKDGEVDFNALRQELGDFSETSIEKYELNWAGKNNAKKIAREDVHGRTLDYIEKDSKSPDETNNLYIEGENLEVLKLLRQNYYNSIKMIYIDPPYNTGNDFVYKDDFSISKQESDINEGIIDEDGEKYVINVKSQNRFHATWLSNIYARLYVAKDLLTDDGIIFISIDNNEIANLKKIADEIFGEESFTTILHVQMSTVQGQKVRAAKAGNIVKNGEYILVYSKNGEKAIGRRALLDPVKYDNHYNKYLKVKEPGVYECINLSDYMKKDVSLCKELELLGLTENGRISSNSLQEYYDYSPLFKAFVNNNSKQIVRIHDSVDAPDEFKSKMQNDLVYEYSTDSRDYLVTKGAGGKINQCIRIDDKIQKADDFYETYGPTTIRGDWWAGFYLDMGNVSKEGDVSYDNGKKPVRLIKQLIEFCTEDGDTILDFFAGSGTTAHAVFEAEAELKEKRNFILIQVDENLDDSLKKADAENKKTIKNAIDFLDSCQKPHILSELGKERIRRAGDKIKEKYPDDNIDIGFKVFRTANTNIKWNSLINMGQLDLYQIENTPDAIDFMPNAKDIDIVYEIMLRQRNIPISEDIKALEEIGTRTFLYANTFLVCLETELCEKTIDKIASIDPIPAKYIFRDSAFKDNIEFKDEAFRRLKALVEKVSGETKSTYTVEFI